MLRPLLFSLLLACLSACRQDQCPTSVSKAHPPALMRIALAQDIQTMDPRLARDLNTLGLMRQLYEGLMTLDENNNAVPALAQRVDVSPDGKIYTFSLRDDAFWSNGDKVTAQDFAYAWKSVLYPNFKAPNAHRLFPIRLARRAKEGDAFVDAVGIDAPDAKTLVVELERPNSQFLKAISMPFFYPINSSWVASRDWENDKNIDPLEIPTNGPYLLKQWDRNDQLVLAKNPRHRLAQELKIDTVEYIISDAATALKMFEQDDLDWVGSPYSTIPHDALTALQERGCVSTAPALGVYWVRFNSGASPFNNAKMRQAFSLALDRKSLTDHVLKGGQQPAGGVVPASQGLQQQPLFKDNDVSTAWLFFNQALDEMGINAGQLPPLTLCYTYNDRNHKIAQVLQQQWQRVFHIKVTLESCEGKSQVDRLRTLSYQMALGSWFADIDDPIDFLEVFEYKNNGTNNTGWEDSGFQAELAKARNAASDESHQRALAAAQKILIDQMVVAPLFDATFSYLVKDRVKGAVLKPLGYIDLRQAEIRRYNIDEQ